MPVAGGVAKALERGKAIGCECVQVFTSNPQQWASKQPTEEVLAAWREARAATDIASVVSHDSYLVNLCAPNPEIAAKSRIALAEELQRCAALEIGFVVSHMGAHLGQGEDAGLLGIAAAARDVLAETPESVTLLMETTAGQGSSLGYRFEQLARVLELCGGQPRLGVCLDTCHVFAAGYDIRTAEAYEATMAEFSRLVGFERLGAVHANDSKKALGSRVDRHEHIGRGLIGEEAFRCLVNDARLAGKPVILETPEAETMHATNLAALRSLVRA